jgi:hypothetical protein
MNKKRILFHQNLLRNFVEYRLLSTQQIVLLTQSNSRTVLRWMKSLVEADIIHPIERAFSGTQGRPEKLFTLSKNGVQFCIENQLIDPSISPDRILWDSLHSLEHQLNVNWVLIHAMVLERFRELKIHHISHTSPLHPPSENGAPFLKNFIPVNDQKDNTVGFIPDALITITRAEDQKSLLFFLELDQTTESLSGISTNSIKQKILNYQNFFRYSGYKRYEQTFNCEFIGFRLLFVANTEKRQGNICRLVRYTPPSDFIWVTELQDFLTCGMGARIWNRGGDMTQAAESILGNTLAFSM